MWGPVLGCLICCGFVGAPLLAIAVIYIGFNIQNAYSSYLGGILNGEEWAHATLPISLFLVAGFFSILAPAVLLFGMVKKCRRVLVCYLALLGLVVGIVITSWIFLKKQNMSGSIGNAVSGSMEKYYDHNQPEPVRNISVEFWKNFQTNLQCCGIHNPSDWVDATGAPTVGFVPNSCCLVNFKSTKNCTNQITKENVNDLEFTSKLIYRKSCLSEFNSYYSINDLGYWAIALGALQLVDLFIVSCFLLMVSMDLAEFGFV